MDYLVGWSLKEIGIELLKGNYSRVSKTFQAMKNQRIIYPNLEKRASMRMLVFVTGVLLITAVLMTGCTSPLKSTDYSSDQILGTWRYQGNLLDARINFDANGDFHMNVQNAGQDLRVLSGKWDPVDTNDYTLSYTTNAQETWIYDPASDTIHESRYTSVIYSRYEGSYEIK
jgi:hypothetical protein